MNGLGNRFFPFFCFQYDGTGAGFAVVALCGTPKICDVRSREIKQRRNGFIGHLLSPFLVACAKRL